MEPKDIVRTHTLDHTVKTLFDNGPIYQHPEGLVQVNEIAFPVGWEGDERLTGALLLYDNPDDLHAVSSEGLQAYLDGIEKVTADAGRYDFLIMESRYHPFHVGANLKENIARLESGEYLGFTEERVAKGTNLAATISDLSDHMLTLTLMGGDNYGGSTEIALMTDYRIADERTTAQFTEVRLGIIPGWGGLYLLRRHTTDTNARAMALTGDRFTANQLKEMGLVSDVVETTGNFYVNPKKDQKGAEIEDNDTHGIMLRHALDFIARGTPRRDSLDARIITPEIVDPEKLRADVAARSNPTTYEGYDGMSLSAAQDEGLAHGMPLSPQSVGTITGFFDSVQNFPTDDLVSRRDELLLVGADRNLALYAEHGDTILEAMKTAPKQKIMVFPN